MISDPQGEGEAGVRRGGGLWEVHPPSVCLSVSPRPLRVKPLFLRQRANWEFPERRRETEGKLCLPSKTRRGCGCERRGPSRTGPGTELAEKINKNVQYVGVLDG